MKTRFTKPNVKKQQPLQSFSHPNAIEQSESYANNSDNDDELYNNWELDDYHELTNWKTTEHDGWRLPSTQDPHHWCGQWNSKGCLHSEDHQTHDGKIYIKHYQRSCFRPSCKTCWKKWIGRESNVATRKIEKYAKKSRLSPIHIVLSISNWDYNLDYKKIKQKARKILKEIKILGGSVIFHAFRFNKKLRRWYYSPHFHVVGFGFLPNGSLTETYRQNGWFVKYLGIRKSIFATFYYLLSHCGIRHRTHAITWFGDLSYSKLEKGIIINYDKCPLCGRKLAEIYYKGWDPPIELDSPFEGFLDSIGWHLVETEKAQYASQIINYA